MRQKNAFTMIELLGVIVILSIILVIAVPTIIGSLQANDRKKNEEFLKNVYIAAEAYVEGNIDMFHLDGVETVDYVLIKELIDNSYLNGNMVNPNTKAPIKDESSIIELIKNNEGVIEYTYVYSGLDNLVLIENIEDLVRLAIDVNGGDDKSDSMFHVTRDLDFLSSNSYLDPNDIKFGDINENGITETIKEELTTGKGFKPIGTFENQFKGVFYGRNKIIKNLYINRPAEDDIGLFGSVASSFVNSITIDAGNVVGQNRVGLVIGSIFLGTIVEDMETTGHISNTGHSLGGVVGFTNGSVVSNLKSSANVKGTSTTEGGFGGLVGSLRLGSTLKNGTFDGMTESTSLNTGGLVGYADASIIQDVKFNGSVTGKNSQQDNVGGIVGSATSNSYLIRNESTGNVTGHGYNNGGLAGKLDHSNISESTFIGYLSSISTTKTGTGGLVGWATNGSAITSSVVEGTIEASAPNIGGISGSINNSTVDGVKFIGSVTGVRSSSFGVGGISGYASNSSIIKNSVSSGTIIGRAGNVGGITGSLDASEVSNSIFDGSLSSDSITETGYGGISGYTYAGSKIVNSISLGTIAGGRSNTGGITGSLSNSNINNCFVTSPILGRDGVGGLVGYSMNGSTINNAYSTGSVEGLNYVGGAVGSLVSATLQKSYSISSVRGFSYIGGLVGTVASAAVVNNGYATGDVTLGYKYSSGAIGYVDEGFTGSSSNLYFYANQVFVDYDGFEVIPDENLGSSVTYNDLISTTWQQNVLGDHYTYTSNNYPKLYENDSSGNPTSELLEHQPDNSID